MLKNTEGMINYLEKNGTEEISYEHMYFWSDLKTISTLVVPILSLLANITDRDEFGDKRVPSEGECPDCGSLHVDRGPYEDESGSLQRECFCTCCGKKYREFFVFDGVDDTAA